MGFRQVSKVRFFFLSKDRPLRFFPSLLLLFWLWVPVVFGQSLAPTTIGFVRIEYVFNNATAYQAYRADFDQRYTALANISRQKTEEFRRENQAINDQRDFLSQDEIARQLQELQLRVNEEDRSLKNEETNLERVERRARAWLSREITGILETLGQEEGFDAFVAVQNNGLYFIVSERYDVTEKVLTRLNQNFPVYEVSPFEGSDASPDS